MITNPGKLRSVIHLITNQPEARRQYQFYLTRTVSKYKLKYVFLNNFNYFFIDLNSQRYKNNGDELTVCLDLILIIFLCGY